EGGGQLGAGSGMIWIESERLSLREGRKAHFARFQERQAAIVARLRIARRKLRGTAVPARGSIRPPRLVQEPRGVGGDPQTQKRGRLRDRALEDRLGIATFPKHPARLVENG